MIGDGPVSFWGAKCVGNHQALITADPGPAIPSAQANRTAQLQAWSGATSRHGPDPLQCYASLLLSDAIPVWTVSRYSFIIASIVE